MSAADTAKTAAAGVGAGAVSGAGKGAKYSLIGSAVAGGLTALATGGAVAAVATMLPALGLGVGAVMIAGSLGFLGGGGVAAIYSVVPGTILGSAIGAITRPFKEFNKQREAKAIGVEQARMTMQDELKVETQKNIAMKKAMAEKQAASRSAEDYQMKGGNPLAEGKSDNHFQKQHAKPGASRQQAPSAAPARVGQGV